jgi:exodeoxyribonuclease VII large subunit
MIRVYSLFELSRHIKRVIALNFDEMIWVRTEILDVKYSRGHTYLELVEKDVATENIRAQSKAIVWAQQFTLLKKKYGAQVEEIIAKGVEVSLFVSVEYHEIFGLSLHVHNIDPDYTLGKLALARQQVLEKLQREGLISKNQNLILPEVLQRIAIISSESAAGLQDFLHQLRNNSFGYVFSTVVFSSSMQGQYTREEFLSTMKKIRACSDDFDCIAIVRGGGSRADLKIFDDYEISKAVTLAVLPVFSGIGHETNQSVVDLVSYKSLKTPTAVAAYIIERNLSFEQKMSFTLQQIKDKANLAVAIQKQRTQIKLERIHSLAQLNLKVHQGELLQLKEKIHFLIDHCLTGAQSALQAASKSLELLDPQTILRRGYSKTEVDGYPVKSIKMVKPDQKMLTLVLDGKIWSKVTKTQNS